MSHPFQAIAPEKVWKVLIPLIVLTIILMILLNGLGASLNNSVAPDGMISFELAGDVDSSQGIINSWNAESQLIAAFSLGLDYLFLVVYSTTIGLGCIWAISAFRPKNLQLVAAGLLLAWGQWLAALFDGVENAALYKLLLGDLQSPWPEVARIFATLKFILIALGLIYIMIGALIKIIRRTRS
jgi:hypothetical protein